MTTTERVPPAPPLNAESQPFYEAARAGRLLLRRCGNCARVHWYPRAVCPHCFSADTAWVEASGQGVIYSFSTMRRVDPPYTLAYVTLAEGPTMLTNLVDCDPDRLAIGQAVRLVFKASDDGTPVPCFTPA